MTGLRQRTLLDGNDLFVEFKGALTEQYVCQQLKTIDDLGVYYYTNDRGSCEVDFISASNESKSCLHGLDDCREGRIPRPLGRFKFDALLLAAGYLTGIASVIVVE